MMRDYCLGLYEKSMPNSMSLAEKLREAKYAGFDYLEISIDETDEKLSRLDWSREQIHDLREAVYTVDLPIHSMCLSGHRKYPLGSHDRFIRQKSLGIMEKAIDFASSVGIRIIQLAGYDVYYETSDVRTVEYFRKNLKASVAFAAKKGVLLAFETMETAFMDTAEKAMRFVDEMESPYLHVYPDTGNLTNAALLYGTDVMEDLRTAKGHLCALHLKETLPAIYREVPFGKGHVNFKAMIQSAMRMGVRLYTAEFWCTGNGDWRNEIVRARDFFGEINQHIG